MCSGSGVVARRIRDELKCDVYAIEPGASNNSDDVREGYLASCNQLGAERVGKYTAQDAASRPEYIEQFDVVTVFKWNVPVYDARKAIHALARFIKPEGVVIVHVVERERLEKREHYEMMYLMDYLREAFEHVEEPIPRTYIKPENGRADDMICVCRTPTKEKAGTRGSKDLTGSSSSSRGSHHDYR